jgi:two-component system, NtrC family, sensor kinase
LIGTGREDVPRQLASKLILSLTIIVIISGGIAGFINVKGEELQLLNSMIVGADQLSKGITSATWKAMLADRRDDAYDVIETIAMKQGINRIRIFNKDGRLMFSTRRDENKEVDKKAEVCSPCHQALQPKVKVDVNFRSRVTQETGEKRKLAIVTPIYNEPSCSQAACHAHPSNLKVLGVLDVTLDLDPVDKEIATVKMRVLAVTGTEILLIGIFIFFFTRHFVSTPIRKLIEGTRAVSEMQLDRPVEIDTQDELGELARSFNRMNDRLMKAMGEINEFTQSLETKVQERTEQLKAAHQKLLQSDRLASLGQLSASVAHEINNPLSGVLNLSMLMQRILKDDGIPTGRIEEFRKYLSQVISETSRVGRIVSDLLAFSRRSKPQSTNADLNNIIKTTVSLVSHKLKLSNVEVELALEDTLPLLRCDNSQIQQVVMNLVLNAAEATQSKGNGKVKIHTRSDKKAGELIFEVDDNGEGMPPERISKIFDPFFTTKPEGKGVGLGLAVVYGIVDSHGGDIAVSSKVGEGTRFKVTLPIAGRDAESRSEPKSIGARE